jgi:hypothetical protein
MAITGRRAGAPAPLGVTAPAAPLAPRTTTAMNQASGLVGTGGNTAAYMGARRAQPVSTLGTTPTPAPPTAPYSPTATNTPNTQAIADAQKGMQDQFNPPPAPDTTGTPPATGAPDTTGAPPAAAADPNAPPPPPPDICMGEGPMPDPVAHPQDYVAWQSARDRQAIADKNKPPPAPDAAKGQVDPNGPMPDIKLDPEGYLAWQKAHDALLAPPAPAPNPSLTPPPAPAVPVEQTAGTVPQAAEFAPPTTTPLRMTAAEARSQRNGGPARGGVGAVQQPPPRSGRLPQPVSAVPIVPAEPAPVTAAPTVRPAPTPTPVRTAARRPAATPYGAAQQFVAKTRKPPLHV